MGGRWSIPIALPPPYCLDWQSPLPGIGPDLIVARPFDLLLLPSDFPYHLIGPFMTFIIGVCFSIGTDPISPSSSNFDPFLLPPDFSD